MVSVHDLDTSRTEFVETALKLWTGQLIDLGRRNNLLFFRDLKTGTIDIGGADEDELARLMQGGRVRASQLFPDPADLQRARQRLTAIRRKVRLLAEERGIDAGFVAIDMLSWDAPQSSRATVPTRAPVLLRGLTIEPKGINGADFILTLAETAELNPVLAYALHRQRGVDISGVAAAVEAADVRQQLDVARNLLLERAAAARVDAGFESKVVASAFAYEKLPMVRDLEESTDLLSRNPMTAALAGDPRAERRLQQLNLPVPLDLDAISPQSEHLVIDADPSQQQAIAAVLAGSNLILQGPPGTGKSQTIANLIAEAAASGRTVLFVAQKRAAIDAVVHNLQRHGLADLVLDLHDPKTQRKAVIEQIRSSMEKAGLQPRPDTTEIDRRLVDRRTRSRKHSMLMTTQHPFGLSIEQLQQHLAELPPERNLGVILPIEVLRPLPLSRVRELQDDLAEFVEADGLRLWRGQSPWANAAAVATDADLLATRDHLDQVSGQPLRDTQVKLQQLLTGTGLPRPSTITQWGDALDLITRAATVIGTYGPDIFGPDLERTRGAVAERAWRKRSGIQIGFGERRRLRRAVRSRRSAAAPWPVISDELGDAVDVQVRWAQLSRGALPRIADGTIDAVTRYQNLRNHLAAIAAITVMPDLADRDESDTYSALGALRDDDAIFMRLPQLNSARHAFRRSGLAELIDRTAERDLSPVEASQALLFSWLWSWLRAMQYADAEYASFSATTQDRLISEFREADTQHITLAAARVRRAVAERQVQARDKWPDQRQIVREQVSRKSRHKPIRQLVGEAPDLLLATKPCWAMSPLVVSQVLPGQQLFDIVVFDEASQIEPADAIPSIMRGRRVVVAGDNQQLPPTNFFSTALATDDDVDAEGALDDFESILDRLNPYVPSRTLTWHYRSRDERLIAFSNREIYDHSLVTFPSTYTASALRHVIVHGDTPPGGSFLPVESERVVELVLRHAMERPDESLGVITLGLRGVEPINARLRAALADRPELTDFFDEDREVGKRFFVKNIENVQGDERDAIILSVGGSRTATGGVNHNFGPINQKGGERRLNVAVTRARRSLVVVSSFAHHELREESLTSRGMRFLRDYLRFADQTREHDVSTGDTTKLSPIEMAIVNRLQAVGMNVRPRYGSADSRIDIAAGDAGSSDRLLLAIEIDGAAYHRGCVRERDRLRPAQLQRMGWRHERIWTTEWLRDPNGQVTRLSESLRFASDSAPPDQTEAADAEPMPLPSPIAAPPTARRLPRPRIVASLPIAQQPRYTLVALAQWLDSDGLLRDEEEMIYLMMAELGYQRRGIKIVENLRAAVRVARVSGRS